MTGMPQCHGSTSGSATLCWTLGHWTLQWGAAIMHHLAAYWRCYWAACTDPSTNSTPAIYMWQVCRAYGWQLQHWAWVERLLVGCQWVVPANTWLHASLPWCPATWDKRRPASWQQLQHKPTPCVRAPGCFSGASIGPSESQPWGGSDDVCLRHAGYTGMGRG